MVTKFKKTKKDQGVLFSILILILFTGLIGSMVYSNWRINQKRTELMSRIETLKKEISDLEEKNTKLEAGITQTEKESYWEEKIREQGYKREGEEQVVVLPPKEGKSTSTESQKNFLEKIIEKLGF